MPGKGYWIFQQRVVKARAQVLCDKKRTNYSKCPSAQVINYVIFRGQGTKRFDRRQEHKVENRQVD